MGPRSYSLQKMAQRHHHRRPLHLSRTCRVTKHATASRGGGRPSIQVDGPAAENYEENVPCGAKRGRIVHSAVQLEDCRATEGRESGRYAREIITRSPEAAMNREEESMAASSAHQVEVQWLPRIVQGVWQEWRTPYEVEVNERDVLLPNIDEADEGNPMAMVDYAEDIYTFCRKAEAESCVPPNYLCDQPDTCEGTRPCEWRAGLVAWLMTIHRSLRLIQETLFLAVNLVDRYLSRERGGIRASQLAGVTALVLACKYLQVFVPPFDEFISVSPDAFTKDEISDMERTMLRALQFNISVPTPYTFMTGFLKAAKSDRDLQMVSSFLAELCLLDYAVLKYPPSLLAAATVYTGRCVLGVFPFWSEAMERHTTYTANQLTECAKLIVELHQNAGRSRFETVHEKYSTPKFSLATRHRPALWLLS